VSSRLFTKTTLDFKTDFFVNLETVSKLFEKTAVDDIAPMAVPITSFAIQAASSSFFTLYKQITGPLIDSNFVRDSAEQNSITVGLTK
jgi:hypothetical protein